MKKTIKAITAILLMLTLLTSITVTEGLAALFEEVHTVYEMGEFVVDNREIQTKRSAKSKAETPDITLLVGDSTELFVNVKDSDGNPVTNAPLVWTASPEGVVSLEPRSGDTRYVTITGLSSKDSPVTVTATLESASKSVVVEVLDKDVAAPDGTTIVLSKEKYECGIGEQFALSGELFSPNGINGIEVKCSATDESAIDVNESAPTSRIDTTHASFSTVATAKTAGWYYVTVRTTNGARSTRRVRVWFGGNDDVSKTISFGSGNSVYVELNRHWFQKKNSNKKYNHNLARFCAAFSMLGYSKNEEIESYLKQCGFFVLNREMDTGRDEVNTFVAVKSISVDGMLKNLIFVGTIGSHKRQWYSDFDPYGRDRDDDTPKTAFSDTHLGFADARDYAYRMLENALRPYGLDQSVEKNIFLFTGHSRGAATANILAAKVIDEGKWVRQDSVYAYTFATPNSIDTSKRHDLHDNKYLCIFNIVNPEDFVTKVMLKSWNYDRFGTTLVLPSKTNTKLNEYNRILRSMQIAYDQYHNHRLYQPYDLGEFSTWSIIKEMGGIVPNVSVFYSPFLKTSDIDLCSPYKFFCNTIVKMVSDEGFSVVAEGISTITTTFSSNSILSLFYKSVLLYFFNLDIYEIWDLLNGIVFEQDEWKSLIDGLDFARAHLAETYCAYMNALTEKEITAEKKGFCGSVNCPVDVEIVEKTSSEVVGRIVNNVVDEEVSAKENSVVMVVNGDEKSFWLPSDGDYEVKLIGNDSGTMDYTLATIDSDAGEQERSNFFDVELTDGLTYTSDVGNEDFSLQNYTLTCEDGTVIEHDEFFDENNAPEYTVTVAAEGNGTVEGNATYVSGDYATVFACPDEGNDFDGWYSYGTLVSTEETYRFRMDADVALTAKFVPHTHVPGAAVRENEVASTITTAGSHDEVVYCSTCGEELSRKTVTVAPLAHDHVYTSSVTTEPSCTEKGVKTYTCECGDSYTRVLPALGHLDKGNDGYCDRCSKMMTGGEHCPKCGKIHNGGFFDKLTGFFHRLIYRLTHLFG